MNYISLLFFPFNAQFPSSFSYLLWFFFSFCLFVYLNPPDPDINIYHIVWTAFKVYFWNMFSIKQILISRSIHSSHKWMNAALKIDFGWIIENPKVHKTKVEYWRPKWIGKLPKICSRILRKLSLLFWERSMISFFCVASLHQITCEKYSQDEFSTKQKRTEKNLRKHNHFSRFAFENFFVI